MTSQSAAFTGAVVHARRRPRAHRLRYRVFYLLLDLDELPALERRLRLFGYNRPAVFSFHDRDHGQRDGRSVRHWVEGQLAAASIDHGDLQISILCMPRILGYVFNPLTVYFCRDRSGRTIATLYEVSNTFGESHTYVAPVTDDTGGALRHNFDKRFYVSPFVPMQCRYDIRLIEPGQDIGISIRESDADGVLLTAAFRGQRNPLSDRFLAGTLLRYPLLTLKVMAGIHWEAIRLWVKGTPVFRHTAAVGPGATVIDNTQATRDV